MITSASDSSTNHLVQSSYPASPRSSSEREESIAHRLRVVYFLLYSLLVVRTFRVANRAREAWPDSAAIAGVPGAVVTGLLGLIFRPYSSSHTAHASGTSNGRSNGRSHPRVRQRPPRTTKVPSGSDAGTRVRHRDAREPQPRVAPPADLRTERRRRSQFVPSNPPGERERPR
jgi:hypothetical protein